MARGLFPSQVEQAKGFTPENVKRGSVPDGWRNPCVIGSDQHASDPLVWIFWLNLERNYSVGDFPIYAWCTRESESRFRLLNIPWKVLLISIWINHGSMAKLLKLTSSFAVDSETCCPFHAGQSELSTIHPKS